MLLLSWISWDAFLFAFFCNNFQMKCCIIDFIFVSNNFLSIKFVLNDLDIVVEGDEEIFQMEMVPNFI